MTLVSQAPWSRELFAERSLDSDRWMVLHTRPQQENRLAAFLDERQIRFYFPQILRRRIVRGRIKGTHVPLFPGYLFLLGGPEDRLAALKTNRIVHTLAVANQEEFWEDLRQIHELLHSGLPVTPEEKLAPGCCVEIRGGPLAGLRGKVIRAASGRRFVIEVNFIQRGASVLIEDFNLEPDREANLALANV